MNRTKLNKEIDSLENRGYSFDYCIHCEVNIIICPKCKNISCNAGGCSYCNCDWPFYKNSDLFRLTKSDYDQIMFERIK